MFVYRLDAPNDSEGARLYGGRWNRPGTPVIYTSATRALAALEVIVHYGAIPEDYRIVVIELPESLAVENVSLDDLPYCWVIDPGKGSAWEYHSDGEPTKLPANGALRAGDLSVPLTELFAVLK